MKRTNVELVDDIDGTPAARTVTFALDGRTYEIDLHPQHYADLAIVLAPYMQAGRPVTNGKGKGKGKQGGQRARHRDTSKVRAWAAERGIPVAPRGRVPSHVQEQYERENGAA